MGKKRQARKQGGESDASKRQRALARIPKKKVLFGVLNINATFNNTYAVVTDQQGNVVMWASTGSLGFKGTKKSTPYAAARVGQLLGDKAKIMGMEKVDIVIKGVGPGRESAMRSFVGVGVQVHSIKDVTPVAHNGPKAPKARRV